MCGTFGTFTNATVGEIVASDFRTAGVFERYGIDFCCGGRQPFDDACRAAAADPAAVIRDLEALAPENRPDDAVARWPVDRLIDHIESAHHTYVRAALPRIAAFIAKLVAVHGRRHPELALVASAFDRMRDELSQHLLKEEQVLFPYIRELAGEGRHPHAVRMSPFGTVENPIRMMEREHRDAGDELQLIRELTGNYTAPADGCTTYAVCMAELKAFELDLHRHIHLENNVLFPKAIALEQS